jgi:penicillin-binding protein 1A
LKIVDSNNKVLEDHVTTKPATTQVLDPAVADTVTDVLRGVIQSGTGTAADIGRPAAGKTGTTSNFTNAWFVGYTPTLSTAVWMGDANNESTPLRNIKGIPQVFGGTIPAQTWHTFMLQALSNVPATDFTQAPPIQAPPDALKATTTEPIKAGPPRAQPDTGPGGPYSFGAPEVPIAPPPAATTSTSTSTTVPSSPPGSGVGTPPTTATATPTTSTPLRR